jgi:hypothetical protein
MKGTHLRIGVTIITYMEGKIMFRSKEKLKAELEACLEGLFNNEGIEQHNIELAYVHAERARVLLCRRSKVRCHRYRKDYEEVGA